MKYVATIRFPKQSENNYKHEVFTPQVITDVIKQLDNSGFVRVIHQAIYSDVDILTVEIIDKQTE